LPWKQTSLWFTVSRKAVEALADQVGNSRLKRSFPPVVDGRARVLVLGSLPGERSLAAARYYAHPRNQFWRLMGEVIGMDLASLEYGRRLEALLAAHVGLWDVVQSAAREGSLDGNIRGHRANPLREITSGLPQLRAVGFNGGASARIGGKALAGSDDLALIPLPSSSPAYTLSLERKREAWVQLRAYL
jgi:hypoxanthine-DNA glycosylase